MYGSGDCTILYWRKDIRQQKYAETKPTVRELKVKWLFGAFTLQNWPEPEDALPLLCFQLMFILNFQVP